MLIFHQITPDSGDVALLFDAPALAERLADGVKVRIVADESIVDDDSRFVRVLVLEGEHSGRAGNMPRRDLRPIGR
jgi:hypothetical protein